MSELHSGKWVCEQKGIPTENLVAACNSGQVTAYSPKSGQKILASSQCRKNFLFNDPLYFSLLEGSYPSYVGFNKDDLYNFSIYLGKLRVNSSKCDSDENIDPSKTNIDESGTKRLSIIGYHVLQEVHYKNECYLFFFKRNCNQFKTSDIYKNIDCLYQINEIIFEPKREGSLKLRLMDLELHHRREHISTTKIYVKKITYGENSKLILDENNDNSVLIYHDGLQCVPCTASPLRNRRENRHFFSNAYKECRKDFHQYKLNYFKSNDKEFKNPLQLKKDFFIFDYTEYCQQTYLQENVESRSDFYEYIESLFFDINELENIFNDDFEDDEILEDPLGYMKLKCISLLKKYKGFDEEQIIYAYFTSLSSNIPYAQLNDIFFPSEKDHDPDVKTSRFSRHIDKFKRIAADNNFPYINADQLRNLTSLKILEGVKKSIRDQLAAIRTKKGNSTNRD